MSSSRINAERIEAGHHTLASICAHTACQECQDNCWEVQILIHGEAGGVQYRTCVMVRSHLELGEAVTAAGRWLVGHGAIITENDNARWVLEHQLRLL